MKRNQSFAARGKLLKKLIVTFLLLIVAAVVYGAIRYFVLAGMKEFELQALYRVLWETVPALILLIAALITVCVLYRRMVLNSVISVVTHIAMLVEDRKEGRAFRPIEAGELNAIETALAQMEQSLGEYLEKRDGSVRSATEEKLRLEIAQKLQTDLVPAEKGYGELAHGIGACVQTASNVGGDYYDYFPLDRHRICVAIGDIWGNGLPAAYFLMRLKELVREHVSASLSLTESMKKINAALCENNPERLVATLFVGIFNPENGELRYLNAGHIAPVMVGEKDDSLSVKAGTPLGVYDDAMFVEEFTEIKPGHTLVFYTDGVTSAYNEKKEFFGRERLFSAVRTAWDSSLGAEHIARSVRDAVLSFRGKQEAADDFAVLALYYPNGLQKVFRPVISELEVMRDLLLEWLRNDPRRNKIYLACEEIFTNIVNHSGASSIHLGCQREGNSLVFRFTDDGEPFNPLPAPTQDKSFYDFGNGGMGMAIIRQIAGEVYYRTKENRNVLTMRFPVYEGM